ncbi:hypothetical protein [Kitasatospora sp. NPDC092286]|uniref:hypothetical protein n=1 Tax=Kitasatospora sp. NPDC092286 TaxID=3364087 RepID=UPI0038279F07
MQVNSSIQEGRRYGWLPALALAAVAVAGCSSSGGGGAAAASAPVSTPPATTASAPVTPATPAAGAANPAPTAAPAGKRPADACTMLTSAQVVAVVGTAGPFRGTHPDPASDGSAVWGCTWGSHQSYAAIKETAPDTLARVRADSDLAVTTVPGIGQEAVATAWKKDGTRPMLYLVAGGHTYSVAVVKDRGPGDDVNAPAETLAEAALATTLAVSLTS